MKTSKRERKEKLEKLAEDAASEDTSSSFMTPKRKRGRPSKAEKALEMHTERQELFNSQFATEQINNNKIFVKPAFKLLSDLGVRYAESSEAAMSAEQMEIMVNSAAICIHQYLPDLLGEHAALITLSIAMSQWSISVYLLRQAKLSELRAQAGAKYNSSTSAETDLRKEKVEIQARGIEVQ